MIVVSSPHNVKMLRLHPKVSPPSQATATSAGFDLENWGGTLSVKPHSPLERLTIETGIALEMPPDMFGLVTLRSGYAKRHRIWMPNGVGIIDPDYRGQIKVVVVGSPIPPDVCEPDGERFAQIVFLPRLWVKLTEAEALGETARSAGGFGSTGQ